MYTFNTDGIIPGPTGPTGPDWSHLAFACQLLGKGFSRDETILRRVKNRRICVKPKRLVSCDGVLWQEPKKSRKAEHFNLFNLYIGELL